MNVLFACPSETNINSQSFATKKEKKFCYSDLLRLFIHIFFCINFFVDCFFSKNLLLKMVLVCKMIIHNDDIAQVFWWCNNWRHRICLCGEKAADGIWYFLSPSKPLYISETYLFKIVSVLSCFQQDHVFYVVLNKFKSRRYDYKIEQNLLLIFKWTYTLI